MVCNIFQVRSMDFYVFIEAEDGIGVDETGTGDWNFNLSSNEEAIDYMV